MKYNNWWVNKLINHPYVLYINLFMNKLRLEIFCIDTSSKLELPFVDEGVRAGFPSPAQDFMELCVDEGPKNKDYKIKKAIQSFIDSLKGFDINALADGIFRTL